MAQGKRFKFQGSMFQVQTAYAATVAITAITKASPAVVTATAHGYASGDVVKIAAVVGMTEVNDKDYVIGVVTSDTFELVGVDSTAYGAYTSGGTSGRVTFTDFCELKSFNQQDAAANEIDVTTICSTQKEFEVGLSDSGSLSLEYNYAGNETVQAALRAAKVAGTQVAFRVVLPNSGGTLLMFGSVQQQGVQAGVNDVYKGTATIKLSGELYVLA